MPPTTLIPCTTTLPPIFLYNHPLVLTSRRRTLVRMRIPITSIMCRPTTRLTVRERGGGGDGDAIQTLPAIARMYHQNIVVASKQPPVLLPRILVPTLKSCQIDSTKTAALLIVTATDSGPGTARG